MSKLTHLDDAGAAHMVDVGAKATTSREAVAEGRISMSAEALSAIRDGTAKKGDVLAVARVAGIMAAKKTSDLIPLCHPLPLTSVKVAIEHASNAPELIVTARVKTAGKTGVEMEALTAVTAACLTLYDMLKAVDKAMVIGGVELLEKTGGKSGTYRKADT